MRRRLFNKRMMIRTSDTQADGMGGVSLTGLPAAGIVPCRCEAVSGDERLIWRQEGVDVTHALWCPATVRLTAAQTIHVLEDNPEIDYEIRFVLERGGRTKHQRAVVQEFRHDRR